MAIAEEQSFAVVDLSVTARQVVRGRGTVRQAGFESHRQLRRRAEVAEQQFRQCTSTFLTWVPGLDDRGHGIHETAHVHAAARRENDDGVLVGIANLRDELVLT